MLKDEVNQLVNQIIQNPKHIIEWQNKESNLIHEPSKLKLHLEQYTEDFVFDSGEDIKVYIDFPYNYGPIPSDINILRNANMHSHDFFEMFYILRGTCFGRLDSNYYTLPEGSTWIFNTNIKHAVLVPSDGSILVNILVRKSLFTQSLVHMLPDDDLFMDFFIDSIYGNHRRSETLDFQINEGSSAEYYLLSIIKEHYSTKNHNKDMMVLLFSSLLIELSRSLKASYNMLNKKNELQIAQIISYISDNYDTVTLKSIADKFHYTEEYLSTFISTHIGMTFTEYLRQHKMKTANKLLSGTNQSIEQIAQCIGYCQRSSFEKEYKKYYGITPVAYRKQNTN